MNQKFSIAFGAIALAFAALNSIPAFAEAPAAEVPVINTKVEKAFEGTSEISSLVTNGNTKTQTTGLGVDLTYRPSPWLVNLKSKYATTITQDVQTQEQFEISGRGGRKLTDSTDVFVEELYLKNRFQGTDNRMISNAGAGHFWVENDTTVLRNEAALGYTNEERVDNTKRGFTSGFLGLVAKYKFTSTSDISHETRYMPNFQTSDDWRLTTETALSSAISSMLSSKISWKYEHVNMPAAGKVKGDTTTTVSLLAKF